MATPIRPDPHLVSYPIQDKSSEEEELTPDVMLWNFEYKASLNLLTPQDYVDLIEHLVRTQQFEKAKEVYQKAHKEIDNPLFLERINNILNK